MHRRKHLVLEYFLLVFVSNLHYFIIIILLSGTLEERLSHHLPIFHVFNRKTAVPAENKKHIQYYDYCKSNVENFVTCIDKELNENNPDNFSGFASIYSETLDKCCKLDKPRNSKRTQQANPWLTPGIINACARKHELCKLWVRATKRKCIYRLTDSTSRSKCICYYCQDIIKCRETFKDYRRTLKHLIKNSKRGFYSEKITDCQGDSKKMWEIINGLRGKCKRQIKPQFIIYDLYRINLAKPDLLRHRAFYCLA